MAEVRNLPEGILRWVQASGASGWATAATPASGTFGYVRPGMTFTQPHRFEPVFNRGQPGHFKFVRKEVGTLQFRLGYGITAEYPPTAITASGVSVPQIHLEWEAQTPEDTRTGIYWQFRNCTFLGPKVSEGEQEDEIDFQFQYISHNGPTASGYLGV